MQRSLVGQNVLVVGPGWLGQATADQLRRSGASVWTLQRSVPDSGASDGRAAVSHFALQGDIRALSGSPTWQSLLPDQLDAVIVTVAPSRAAGDSHEHTYPSAVSGALQFAGDRGCHSLVYTSSTGVYGRIDGGESHEGDPIVPRDPRQQALRDAELVLDNTEVSRGVQRTVLRVAGLYGPGRDPAPRFRQTVPSGDADTWCNFSWRDDVVGALVHVVSIATPGEGPGERARIYNCSDGVPLRASTIARALGAAETSEERGVESHAPSGRSNQQIRCEALRATGWAPTMRTVFDGLRALGHAVPESAETTRASATRP